MGMKGLLGAAILLSACDGTALNRPAEALGPYSACEIEVCDYVPVCQRRHIGAWDWTSTNSCLGSFRCGVYPDACREAVLSLPCLDQPGDDWMEVTEANRLGWITVRNSCQWDSL